MDLGEIGGGYKDRIHVAHYRVLWHAVLIMIINLWVPWKMENFLI